MTIGDDQQAMARQLHGGGTNGGGDYWFVHRDGSARGLWFWQHEAQQIEQDHATFQDYMAELRREAENPARWQDRRGGSTRQAEQSTPNLALSFVVRRHESSLRERDVDRRRR